MIEAKGISKAFDDIHAIDNISIAVKDKEIFGLIGTNGAGKSTLLRMFAGVIRPDSGELLMDGEIIYENPKRKQDIFYISDEQYFFSTGTPKEMARHYKIYYPAFNEERFYDMLQRFELEKKRKIRTLSKGMKKLISVLLGICSGCRYLLCDEAFDGLDPVMRQAVKSMLAGEIMERELTPIIASHNLRELEDFCDHVGLLHKGGILLSKDLDEMKLSIHKIQCVFPDEPSKELAKESLDILKYEERGSLSIMVARGTTEEVLETVKCQNPLFLDVLPLSLEEIFIHETEVVGYDLAKIIF